MFISVVSSGVCVAYQAGGVVFRTVDIGKPEVMIGGLLGVMMVFYFTGLAVAAVGTTAGEVVNEVRRQFKMNPGIMEFKAKPDYKSCVALVRNCTRRRGGGTRHVVSRALATVGSLGDRGVLLGVCLSAAVCTFCGTQVTAAALKEMRLPGILAVAMPVFVGLFFRFLGEMTGRAMLGAEVLVAFIMFATVAGILMALFLDNVGGAWVRYLPQRLRRRPCCRVCSCVNLSRWHTACNVLRLCVCLVCGRTMPRSSLSWATTAARAVMPTRVRSPHPVLPLCAVVVALLLDVAPYVCCCGDRPSCCRCCNGGLCVLSSMCSGCDR